MLAHALVSSLVVHAFAFLSFLVVPVAAHLFANDSRPLRTLPSFSQPMTEHGMTTSHTFRFAVALGVASLIYSARALRRAACVSLHIYLHTHAPALDLIPACARSRHPRRACPRFQRWLHPGPGVWSAVAVIPPALRSAPCTDCARYRPAAYTPSGFARAWHPGAAPCTPPFAFCLVALHLCTPPLLSLPLLPLRRVPSVYAHATAGTRCHLHRVPLPQHSPQTCVGEPLRLAPIASFLIDSAFPLCHPPPLLAVFIRQYLLPSRTARPRSPPLHAACSTHEGPQYFWLASSLAYCMPPLHLMHFSLPSVSPFTTLVSTCTCTHTHYSSPPFHFPPLAYWYTYSVK
ncbi:hypothetical protein C8R45DRAFT_1091601 [Mycena sanguinolenta]|nr:hypothetical protein C8R45DRAFT_1091601 [Mycena sanguinolenta]